MSALQWLLACLVAALAVWLFTAIYLGKRGDLFFDQPPARRASDQVIGMGSEPFTLYDNHDGPPGGKRGHVWSDYYREIEQQRRRNNVIRIRREG